MKLLAPPRGLPHLTVGVSPTYESRVGAYTPERTSRTTPPDGFNNFPYLD